MPLITVRSSAVPSGDRLETEFAERKGIGHPDSIADGIAEEVSRSLCREYLEISGTVLHHNVDKGLIIGGDSEVRFGGGRITRRIEAIIAGRASSAYGKAEIDIKGIASDAARRHLNRVSRFLDSEREAKITTKIGRGSAELKSLFAERGVPLANDTAFGLGFAPMSTLEGLVLSSEKYLNSRRHKRRFPAVGEDVKVMGWRDGGKLSLMVSMAFVSEFIESSNAYVEYKERVGRDLERFAWDKSGKEVRIGINGGDDVGKGRIYMTKTGLSCESGDDGQVGRGNRVNGLITPFRWMSLEAAAGKNPVSHIGKLYNVLAMKVSEDAVKEYPEIGDCRTEILAQIGDRIDRPRSFTMETGCSRKEGRRLEAKLQGIGEWHLERMRMLSEDIMKGRYALF